MPQILTHRDDDHASLAQPERKNVGQPALLVALHDVTPAHAPRLARAEQLLSTLGVDAVTYLYVPDFHGRAAAHNDPAFITWCRAPRPYRVEWFLHGYFHEEQNRERRVPAATPGHWFARRFLTNGEGEFLSLRGTDLRQRVETGLQSMARTVGSGPAGFVAPAWLYNEHLIPVLQRLGIRFTESHFHIFDLRAGTAIPAPVITWASRSRLRRLTALACTSVQCRIWNGRRFLRLALHPGDVDHPRIVDAFARAIDTLRVGRRLIGYCELGESSAPAAPAGSRRLTDEPGDPERA